VGVKSLPPVADLEEVLNSDDATKKQEEGPGYIAAAQKEEKT